MRTEKGFLSEALFCLADAPNLPQNPSDLRARTMTTKTKAKPANEATAHRMMTGAQIVVEALREQGV